MNIVEVLDREGLRLASNAKRIAAFVIDDIVATIPVLLAFGGDIIALEADQEAIANLISSLAIYIVVLKIAYHTIFTALYGASIGKMICKIQIIKIDTISKPNVIDSLCRSAVRVCSEFLLYIPLLIAFSDDCKRALHDMILKTIVIDVSAPQDM